MSSQLVVWEGQSILCDSTGRGLLETCAQFPPDFVYESFPFADSALCLSTIINHSCEYNSRLSSVGPPSESSNQGMLLGTSDIGCLGDIWGANTTKENLGVNGSHCKIYLQNSFKYNTIHSFFFINS